MTLHLRTSFRRACRSYGRAEVSTMVVVTLSGVPSEGGSVTCGRTGWILAVTKTSLTRDVMMELLPTPSSPHTQIRTANRREPRSSEAAKQGHKQLGTYRSPCCCSMVVIRMLKCMLKLREGRRTRVPNFRVREQC